MSIANIGNIGTPVPSVTPCSVQLSFVDAIGQPVANADRQLQVSRCDAV